MDVDNDGQLKMFDCLKTLIFVRLDELMYENLADDLDTAPINVGFPFIHTLNELFF